jgi:quercetin dioxygenase-like cupin family protein
MLFAAARMPAAKLPDRVFSPRELEVKKEAFGELRMFFEGPTDQLKYMAAGSLRLKRGAEPHPPHKHDEEEFLLITEGSGEISIDGKITKVGEGSLMYCAANKLHGIRNTGRETMEFYFFKWKA